MAVIMDTKTIVDAIFSFVVVLIFLLHDRHTLRNMSLVDGFAGFRVIFYTEGR